MSINVTTFTYTKEEPWEVKHGDMRESPAKSNI